MKVCGFFREIISSSNAEFEELVGNREVRRFWIMKGVYVILMSLDFIMKAIGSHWIILRRKMK